MPTTASIAALTGSSGAGASKYGIIPGPSVDPTTTGLSSVPSASADVPVGELFHPANPLVAFGAIALIAFGLMAFSTSASVRVGHTKAGASIQIGDSK